MSCKRFFVNLDGVLDEVLDDTQNIHPVGPIFIVPFSVVAVVVVVACYHVFWMES